MTLVIQWPNNTTEIIDSIRDTIGRNITIYYAASGIPCPASGCALDPVTNLSTNQFCPVCSGAYWINTEDSLVVKAHVRMREVDIPVWEVGGYIVDGDALVQIKYTNTNLAAVNNSKWFDVDGKKFVLKNKSFRGVPDLNRIVVTLQEKEG